MRFERTGMNLLTVMIVTVFFLTLSCMDPVNDPTVRWDERKAELLESCEGIETKILIELLESDDACARVASYMTLIERGPEEVIPVMIQPDERTKQIMIHYWQPLCAAWGADAVPQLIKHFMPENLGKDVFDSNDDDYWTAWYAVTGFCAVGQDASVAAPMIVEALHNPWDMNLELCRTLVSMDYRSEDAIDALLGVLDEENLIHLPSSACYALGKLASPDDTHVIKRLQEYIEEQTFSGGVLWHNVLAARAALYMLGVDQDENFEIIAEKAWPKQVGQFKVADGEARKALAWIGDERSITELLDVAQNSDDLSIILVYGYLAKYGPEPEIIEVFWRILMSNEEPMINRVYAIYNLGKLGESSKPALSDMIHVYNLYYDTEVNPDIPEDYVFLEESIIRVHEGIEFPSFIQ